MNTETENRDIIIRPAKIEDLAVLKTFEQGVIKFERPFAPNLKEDPIQYYDIADLIEREDAQVLVAVSKNEIIGSGYANIKQNEPYKEPESYAYLGFMYVSPLHRGKGINGKIIDGLMDWTKQRGLTEIQLDVYYENTNAIKAYEKKGFKPSLLQMRLGIDIRLLCIILFHSSHNRRVSKLILQLFFQLHEIIKNFWNITAPHVSI